MAALCLGSSSAWADATSLYERGTTNVWSDADLTDWTSSYCTPTISGGLSVNTTNAGWTNTKAISVTANSIVTLDATLKTGGASGRSGSYDYIKIGGVTVGFNEQDNVAFVSVDGSSTNLSLTYNRTTAYAIQVVINQATGDVSYTVGSAAGSSTSSTAITGIEFGHYKAGRENYGITTVLQKVEVSEEVQAVTMADYTINYIFNEETIKTVTSSTPVGSTVNAENPITIESVKYFAKDGEVTSMDITSGTNVLNVDLRKAESFGYTVKAVDKDDNVLTDLTSGSVVEGDAVSLAYPRWVLSETTLYSCATGSATYSTTFTPDVDGYVKNITYNSGTVENVVFYTEGEDVAGASVGSNDARASKGQMGYTADAETYLSATTLTPGKYKIYMRTQNGNSASRAFNFKVGENIVFTGSFANGTNTDANSDEFTVYENSTLSFASAGSNASGIDYFYVVKTGDATVSKTITAAGWATYCSPYALDFTGEIANLKDVYIVDGVTSGTTLNLVSVKGKTVPANTGLLIEGTEGTCVIPVAASGTADVSANDLVGTTVEATLNATKGYVLMGSPAVGFYKNNNNFTLGANTAYLPVDFAGARSFDFFNLEAETTGINAVEGAKQGMEGVYNLAGQRVAQPTRGLYIVNGRKVVVK